MQRPSILGAQRPLVGGSRGTGTSSCCTDPPACGLCGENQQQRTKTAVQGKDCLHVHVCACVRACACACVSMCVFLGLLNSILSPISLLPPAPVGAGQDCGPLSNRAVRESQEARRGGCLYVVAAGVMGGQHTRMS